MKIRCSLARIIGSLLVVGVLFLQGCGSLVHHRVEKGDTLYSIGWRYDQDFRDIARWNGIKPPYHIKEGQWLRVAPPGDAQWWEDEYPDRAKSDTRIARTTPAPKLKTKKKVRKSAPKPMPVVEVSAWQWPTSPHPSHGYSANKNKLKKGVNIFGRRGQPIVSAAEGKVVYSGSGLVGYGKIIIIKHNKTYLSAYGFNQTILVEEGQQVKKGQKIALMGSTDDGRELLYFEMRKNGKPVNPLKYLPRLKE